MTAATGVAACRATGLVVVVADTALERGATAMNPAPTMPRTRRIIPIRLTTVMPLAPTTPATARVTRTIPATPRARNVQNRDDGVELFTTISLSPGMRRQPGNRHTGARKTIDQVGEIVTKRSSVVKAVCLCITWQSCCTGRSFRAPGATTESDQHFAAVARIGRARYSAAIARASWRRPSATRSSTSSRETRRTSTGYISSPASLLSCSSRPRYT